MHDTSHHETIHAKHLAAEAESQPILYRIMVRVLELSTMELIVAILHLMLTAAAVFGLIGATEGGH